MRADISVAYPDFLAAYFLTSVYWNEIKRGTEGAAQGGFNSSKLAALNIPLPPLPEQKRIVAELDALTDQIGKLERNYQDKADSFDDLKQSLLQKAFAGELT